MHPKKFPYISRNIQFYDIVCLEYWNTDEAYEFSQDDFQDWLLLSPNFIWREWEYIYDWSWNANCDTKMAITKSYEGWILIPAWKVTNAYSAKFGYGRQKDKHTHCILSQKNNWKIMKKSKPTSKIVSLQLANEIAEAGSASLWKYTCEIVKEKHQASAICLWPYAARKFVYHPLDHLPRQSTRNNS